MLTNASAVSFNAKIKALMTQFWGAGDIKFFMYKIKMKQTFKIAMMLLIVAMANVITSCGNDNDDFETPNRTSSNSYNSTVEKLKGTSWKWVRNDWFNNGSFWKSTDGDNSIITFSDEPVGSSTWYLYINGIKGGAWYDNGDSNILANWYSSDDKEKYGSMSNIYKLTSSELVTGNDTKKHYFVKSSSSGSEGGSSSTQGDAPSFRDFSYTYTNNSITVQFLTTENNTTKATIFYGKTTSPSTSISASISGGHIISARITGLTKATKYYVKCSATNKYGTTTSNVYPVMTDSD